jgi:hypothetical protein
MIAIFNVARCGPADAFPASMKYVALLAAVAIAYFVLARHAPVVAVTEAVTQPEAAPLTQGPREPAAPSNPLKAPLDRTHAVLDQVRQRNGNGEF